MAKTKKESVVEKIEETIGKKAKKVVKELTKEVEQIEEKVSEEVEEIKEDLGLSDKKGKKAKSEESTEKKDKLAKLLEKAKALEGKVASDDSDLKKRIKGEDAEDTLVPIEDYLKSSIHLGTRVITPDMRQYVYKRRADGLAVLNTSLIDKKLRDAVDYLSQFSPEDIILVCKREVGWKAALLFSKVTKIRTFTKKYPPGILTNPKLDTFIETKLVFISDPWLDKNALADANNIGVPVLSVCDTNNYTQGITKKIIGNNKSAKSLGIIFYLMAKLYVEKRGLDSKVPDISEFIDDWDKLEPPK